MEQTSFLSDCGADWLVDWLLKTIGRVEKAKKIFELGGGVQFLFGFLCRRKF